MLPRTGLVEVERNIQVKDVIKEDSTTLCIDLDDVRACVSKAVFTRVDSKDD